MDADYFSQPRHAVAVIGGACAGAEAAEILAQAGIYTVVFDQNARPFGKIEDGLPRWHAKQRAREYDKIGGKLTTEGVEFVPSTTIGSDVTVEELLGSGFSAVVLACGAWNDRALGAENAEEAEGNGLIYQNPFIYWFNHHEEAAYDGEHLDLHEGAVVVGGGLASIDVVKALNLEAVAAKLRSMGHKIDVIHMEHKGIDKILEGLGLTFEELGVAPCTLVYRRSKREMPLVQFRPGADEASREKTMGAREKLMDRVIDKFFVRTEFNTLPKGVVMEDGKVAGLRVVSTRTEGRKVLEIEGSERVIPTTQIISSIGSVPRPIPGLPFKGEFYVWKDWDHGVMAELDGVFGVGNVVTGQGNIALSRKNAQMIASEVVVAGYLGVGGDRGDDVAVPKAIEAAAAETAEQVKEHVGAKAKLGSDELTAIRGRVAAWQARVGYDGDFDAWIAKVTPPDRV